MNHIRIYLIFLLIFKSQLMFSDNSFISFQKSDNCFPFAQNNTVVPLLVAENESEGVLHALKNFQIDVYKVTGIQPSLLKRLPDNHKTVVVIGSVSNSNFIQQLLKSNQINSNDIKGKFEKFIIQTVTNPFPGIEKALVVAGSDMRGTIYGIYEFSKQIGISPWYYWADVPVKKQKDIFVKNGIYTDGEPAVRYRGIFLNDEVPALSGWAKHTFGGFNHKFYEKVFELILRLKGNFIWPAMWGNAFYDDDALNGELAHKMGIVVGTSHHEPMGRAHAEWKKYGTGKWDYSKNEKVLKEFWRTGFERQKNFETITTLGMRGDGDEPMSEVSNIKLLQKIVKDQRDIIKNVSGKKITETPQVWALYKEVQDYYDQGMRVPDDVTLLFCDDNWGNVRKLPDLNARPHKGGYGMYYHFDYVGGPRNYKWINVSQIQRVWEQMNLTYSHGVDRIWIVNVGDLKPMEYPISFFLDMAWNPSQFNSQNLLQHTEKWCAQQFGTEFAVESARLINLYTKYNRRVTPELLNDTIYSLTNYNEFERVTNEYRNLALDAFRLYQQIPEDTKDAFYQLVLFPVDACANLYEMYFAVAKNKQLARYADPEANYWADKVKFHFDRDSLLSDIYHNEMSDGKWKHMMSQIRIGYTYWQEPEKRVMPAVTRIDSEKPKKKYVDESSDNRYISIEAAHFSRKNESANIRWEIIPDLGKTLSGITIFPQNKYPTEDSNISLEYEMNISNQGTYNLHVLVSPTLNFNQNRGLRYAVSFNGGKEQIVNINSVYDIKKMEKWQANSINETVTTHTFEKAGKYTLRFRVLEPGIVLQKIMLDMGGLKKSYLGAPEKY